MRWVALTFAGLLLAAPPAYGLSVINGNFDQIAQINALGGSVTQVGGTSPGQPLSVAADFDGSVNASSGVSVTLPGWVGVTGSSSFNDGGSIEPGNAIANVFGLPTDATFTAPDGNGDGSVQILAGGSASLDFAALITAPLGAGPDLFLLTDTAGGGNALIELLLAGSVVDSLATVIPSGPVGSGLGGLLLNIADGVSFDSIRFTATSGAIELDAVLAQVPEPGVGTLLSLALGAGALLRRAFAPR